METTILEISTKQQRFQSNTATPHRLSRTFLECTQAKNKSTLSLSLSLILCILHVHRLPALYAIDDQS